MSETGVLGLWKTIAGNAERSVDEVCSRGLGRRQRACRGCGSWFRARVRDREAIDPD